MICVKIKKENEKIREIIVEGHAEYDEYGKDIVCAGVSSAIYFSLNLIEKLNLKVTYKLDEGYTLLVNDANDLVVDKIFETLEYTFNDLKENYPKYITIKI